jgi:hypothetical protein
MSSDDKQGQVRLDLVDVKGKRLGGKVDISLQHQVLSHAPKVNGQDASKKILIKNLFGAPQGLYRIEIDPSAYLPTSRFVNLEASDITDLKVSFAIDPRRVIDVNFPAFADLPSDTRTLLENSNQVFSFQGKRGDALCDALDDVRKSNVLNLTAKCAATPLGNGKTVLPFIQSIIEIRGDRFFAFVPRELREETKNAAVAGLIKPAPEGLHHLPPQFTGFDHAGSFKTRDKFGNLQLTYFLKDDDCVVDIDIDPVPGLEHLFQVLEHKITGIETHPYAVHDILIAHQAIDPGYSFVV